MSSYETLRATGTSITCLSPVSVWISDYMFARFTCEIAMRTTVPVSNFNHNPPFAIVFLPVPFPPTRIIYSALGY